MEAILVIPLMILPFVAVLYFHHAALAKQLSESHARSCAWAYAGNGCTEKPEGCEDLEFDFVPGNPGSSVWDGAGESGPGALEGRLGRGDLLQQAVYMLIEPCLDILLGGGEFRAGTQALGIQRAIQLGGGEVRVSGEYVLRCNLRSMEPLDILKNLWKEIRDELT